MIFFQRWKKSPHEGFWIFIPFFGDVGRAKRKEKKSKIHYLFSIFRASSSFLKKNFVFWFWWNYASIFTFFVNFLFPIFCLIHTLIFYFCSWVFSARSQVLLFLRSEDYSWPLTRSDAKTADKSAAQHPSLSNQ